MRHIKWVLLLAALSAVMVPGATASRHAVGKKPFVFTGMGAISAAPAGTVVKYGYGIQGGNGVALATATLVLPKGMTIVRKTTTRYRLVKNRPTWTFHNLTWKGYGVFIYAKISPTVKPGTKLPVTVLLVARNASGSWTDHQKREVTTRVLPPQ